MYRSPIELIYQGVEMKIEKGILKAVHKQDINVDREELIKALEYDRGQYEKGYSDALISIVRCKDCKHRYYNEYTEMYCCEQWADGFDTAVRDDEFCSRGERKRNDKE